MKNWLSTIQANKRLQAIMIGLYIVVTFLSLYLAQKSVIAFFIAPCFLIIIVFYHIFQSHQMVGGRLSDGGTAPLCR